MKGLFITFEGGEGAGKTTLIESLVHSLTSSGYRILKTREPGGTELGEEVRHLLLQERKEKMSPFAELALFLASRAQHVREVIFPALTLGYIVLCDRFNDSSIAYQGIARNLGKEKVAAACHFFSEGLIPDLTFYLDIDPFQGIQRVKKNRKPDRIEGETLSFHETIREAYLTLQREQSKRIYLLDATLSKEIVYQEALEVIRRKMGPQGALHV